MLVRLGPCSLTCPRILSGLPGHPMCPQTLSNRLEHTPIWPQRAHDTHEYADSFHLYLGAHTRSHRSWPRHCPAHCAYRIANGGLPHAPLTLKERRAHTPTTILGNSCAVTAQVSFNVVRAFLAPAKALRALSKQSLRFFCRFWLWATRTVSPPSAKTPF